MKKLDISNRFVGILLFFAMLIPGCVSLDKDPLDSLSTGTFWKTETDAMLGLTGIYHNPHLQQSNYNFWSQLGCLYLFEATTDNGFEKDNHVTDINNGSLASTYGAINNAWVDAYQKISRCNNFIDNIDAVQMNPDKLAEMKAEAKVIRAHDYFYLAFYWGDVPLTTHVLTVNEANNIFRTPKNEVMDFVIKELQEAIPLLPVIRPDDEHGRITKGGALGILGRVLMSEKRWEDAKDVYEQIINMGIYIIDPRFKEIFEEKGESSKEHVLVSVRMEDVYGTPMLRGCHGFDFGGYHWFSPYNELVEEFECIDGKPITESPLYDPEDPYTNRDPRLYKTIGINGLTVFKGKLYISHPDSSAVKYQDQVTRRPWSGYLLHKFSDGDYTGNITQYGGDFPMIRYAEVLLSYLESCIESGMPITQNLLNATINKVRGREEVQMPPVTETDPAKLTTILRRERRVELAWEGLRLYDLFRWRIAHVKLKGTFTGMKVCPASEAASYKTVKVDSKGYYFCEETNFRENVDYLWPIPQSERDVNPNLTQNPGY
ncbi:SusD domain-containing protein [Proteiniphilum saccharofermentans]|uniref:SusD domain-containing protein n=1 Tax=Proteiniphilum saccharofermentans TaxID=1642647 RepID=A0A1R3T5V3_9BACT|nr:RagB/SusD family nutrient uptake outer membrane protein [Proteiniphilum saccharofermentans]SCD18944.1 SusD domain-containing protein [Proteiniphilum saccharofermentans]